MFIETAGPVKTGNLHLAHDIAVRFFAVYMMFVAGYAWLRLVGYFDTTQWRFDLMPPHWQVASVFIAVVGPVSALGLWMLAPWGVALWIGLASFQCIIFIFFKENFEPRPILSAFHLLCLICYASLRLRMLMLDHRRK